MSGRYNWFEAIEGVSICSDEIDKKVWQQSYISYQLLKCMRAFKISGLPDTMPERDIKLMLFTNGFVSVTEITPKDTAFSPGLYAVVGGLGGVTAYRSKPQWITWAQPVLGSRTDIIGKDCVIVKNDDLLLGVLPMFNRYALQIVETDITIRIALINQRIEQLISCADENIRKAAENYISDVKSGKISVCADNALIDALKVSPYANTENGRLTSLIEMKQYLKGSWDNEIGLSANYNMKREAISANESERDNDILLPFIDEMRKSWSTGFDEVNAKYGTSIKVELTGSWDEKITENPKEDEQQEDEKPKEEEQQENEIE